MTLQMPGYTYRRAARGSRFAFEWRADEVGVLNSTAFLGLADRGERHVPTFDRTGLAGYKGAVLDHWLAAQVPPLIHPRWSAWDLDDDGIGERLALLTEPSGTNMVPNSYCGTNTTGWNATANASVTRETALDTGAVPLFGKAGLLSVTAAGAGYTHYKDGSTGKFAFTAGQPYAVQVWAWVPAALVGQQWSVNLLWRNAGGSLLSTTTYTFTATRAGRVHWAFMATAPTNTTQGELQVLAVTPLVVNPATLYVEQVQLEQSNGSSPIPADTTAGSLISRGTEPPVTYAFPETISPMGVTLYAKAVLPWGASGPIRSGNAVLGLGVKDDVAGGTLALTGYAATRYFVIERRVGATIGNVQSAVLPVSVPQPLAVLGHVKPDGTVDLAVRDANGVEYVSTPNPPSDKCSAHPGKVGSVWGASTLVLGGSGIGASTTPVAGGVGLLRACYSPGIRTWDEVGD